MPTKIKLQVVSAFAFRLPVVGMSTWYFAMVSDYLSSDEPQFAVTNALVAQQTLIAVSLISTTIPTLRRFVISVSTGFGVPLQWGVKTQTSNNHVYALETIGGSSATNGNARRSRRMEKSSNGNGIIWDGSHRDDLRPDMGVTETIILSDGGSGLIEHENGISDTDTQELIIKKRAEWRVDHDLVEDSQ